MDEMYTIRRSDEEIIQTTEKWQNSIVMVRIALKTRDTIM
jgi:hypothetical protein